MRVLSVTLISTILLTLLFAATVTAGPDINEGLWEITVKIEMQGMPIAMPPITNTQCITKDMLVPNSDQPGQECNIINQKMDGNTLTYDVECSSAGGAMKGHGEITYTGDTMTGTVEITMPAQGNMKMITKMTGKRIGPCE